MTLIDRYILARTWRSFAAICGIILGILLLENVSRLLHLLENVDQPLSLLIQFLLALVPEYLGLGVLVALFLATAMTVRSLSLAGEWQIFAATGISPGRLLLIPMMFGAIGAVSEAAIHFYYRPVGERQLDLLLSEVRLGRHGVGGAVRSIIAFPHGVAVTIDGYDRQTGTLTGVFVALPDLTFTAPRARASHDGLGTIIMTLRNGRGLTRKSDGTFNVVDFGQFTVRVSTLEGRADVPQFQALDRLPFADITALARREALLSQRNRPALASIASRLSYSLMALLVPVLGMALGTPTMRGRSGAGIAFGFVLIIGFVRATSFVEVTFPRTPIVAAASLMTVMSGITVLLWRLEIFAGPGIVDKVIDRRMIRPLLKIVKKTRVATPALGR